MANEPKLVAETRTKTGTAESRRLRRRGIIPGNLYGHDLDPVAIAVPEDVLEHAVHTGHRVVDLELDGTNDKAMFREVQWDTFGTHVQHFDLIRISAGERVTVEIGIELHGVAPGVMAGGVMEQLVREFTVECPALEIPDKLTVNINDLQIGDAVHVQDIALPPDVTLIEPSPEATVLQIVEQRVEAEVEAGEEIAPAEPEVIGREEKAEAPSDE